MVRLGCAAVRTGAPQPPATRSLTISGLSDYFARAKLDELTGKSPSATRYVALYLAAPSDAGGGTECSGGSYQRKSTAASDWNSASGSTPAATSNAADITFQAATLDWGSVVAFGLFDQLTSGNLLAWDYLGGFDYLPFSTTDVAGDSLQAPGHSLVANDPVVFSTEMGGSLPTGLSAGTIYYVIASGLTSDVFKVSTTIGGAAVNLTANGSGMARKVQTKQVANGQQAKFLAGTLQIAL